MSHHPDYALDSFEYKFRVTGGGSSESQHCTYCPKQPGEVCSVTCSTVYAALTAERAADGVIVIDEPAPAARFVTAHVKPCGCYELQHCDRWDCPQLRRT